MKLRITVEDKVFEVEVEILEGGSPAPSLPAPSPAAPPSNPVAPPAAPPAPSLGENVFSSPLSGVIRAVRVKVGDNVQANQELIVLEAMKMETSVYAPSAGKVKAVLVKEGDNVQTGAGLVEFE